ncbi:MAG: hypothetical protein WC346_06020 [Methanogenium sp.]|jgi:hypothetical protein
MIENIVVKTMQELINLLYIYTKERDTLDEDLSKLNIDDFERLRAVVEVPYIKAKINHIDEKSKSIDQTTSPHRSDHIDEKSKSIDQTTSPHRSDHVPTSIRPVNCCEDIYNKINNNNIYNNIPTANQSHSSSPHSSCDDQVDVVTAAPPAIDQSHIDEKSKSIDQTTAKKKSTTDENSIAYQLTQLLLDLILERRPTRFGGELIEKGEAYKKKIKSWVDYMDYIIRIDKHDPEKVLNVILWCQKNEFWQKNILSTSKLREQYGRLEDLMDAENPTTAEITEDKNSQLTIEITYEYEKEVLNSPNPNNCPVDWSAENKKKFIKAAEKAREFANKFKIRPENMAKYLIRALKQSKIGSTPLAPGHLCSDHMWTVVMPQFIDELGLIN